MTTRLTTWGPRLGLLAGATLLALVLAEVAARLWLPSNTYPLMYATSTDAFLGVEPRPSQRFEFDGLDVRLPPSTVTVNASGLRGAREVAASKAPGKRRLVCLGDSMTYGWGVNDDETYCEQLAARLGPNVEPVNLGCPGYNLAQSVRRLELRGLPLAPDLVVLLVNGSDTLAPIDHGDPGSAAAWLVDHSALARLIMSAMKRSEQHSVGDGATAGPEASRDGPPKAGDAHGDDDFRAALDGLSRLGAASLREGFEAVVIVFGEAREQPDFIDAMDAWGIAYASAGPAFSGRDDALIIPKDGHPNAAGHTVLADLARSIIVGRGLLSGDAPPRPPWTDLTPPPWEQLYAPRITEAPSAGTASAGTRAASPDGMVAFSGGVHPIGSDSSDGAGPRHSQPISPFELDRHEVTNAEYARFVADGGAPPLDHPAVPEALRWAGGKAPVGGERLPVTMVTHEEAEQFCRSRGARLPTELEWEAAARGTAGRRFPWGDEAPPPVDASAPVGSRPWDQTPEGVVDLYGNVSEWTAGAFLPYAGGSLAGSRAFGRDVVRVVRGAGFSYRGPPMPSATRRPYPVHDRAIDRGFRCARDVAR